MPHCTEGRIGFGRLGRRVIEADFDGGDLSSDGGLMLLRRVDERIGLSRAAAEALGDERDPARIEHSLRDLLAQRLYALCCGYEDLNDHDRLRSDLLMQTAVGRDEPLASSPTLSRLENRATRAQAWALHGVLVDQFVAAHESAPAELVLDIDASDVALHGAQEGSEFHAYNDHHCYLPLYVFCGQAMLAGYLRRSKIDGAKHAGAVIRLLVKRLRRVITRLEYGAQGTNPRFVVTNLEGVPEHLYDRVYCARGEAENRIREAQLDLFGTRASCHRFDANQLRLLLAGLAYTLMQRLRTLALHGTELQRASAATIRVRLLKIGAAILRNTRRVRLMLASHHPLREVFALAAIRLAGKGP